MFLCSSSIKIGCHVHEFVSCVSVHIRLLRKTSKIIPRMNFPGAKVVVSFLVVLLTIDVAISKSIDVSEPEPFQKNQVEFSNSLPDEPPSEAELFRYLLTKELLSRHGNMLDWEERQRKRSYWKQCAFNAVSCFGRK